MGVRAVDAPGTGGHCFIDLAHNTTALDFALVVAKDRPEAFGPFIRVTNSYNGRRALAFDIGFYRKVCQNGMILPDTVVRFHFNHLQREIAKSGTSEARTWYELVRHVHEMCDRYVRELGENAYAIFNVITEFASQLPDNRCHYRERHSLQRRAGTWLTEFTHECRQPDFPFSVAPG